MEWTEDKNLSCWSKLLSGMKPFYLIAWNGGAWEIRLDSVLYATGNAKTVEDAKIAADAKVKELLEGIQHKDPVVRMVRAKFQCTNKTTAGEIWFTAAIDEENKSWSKWTPFGQLKMVISNPDALAQFEAGEYYFLDFTPV